MARRYELKARAVAFEATRRRMVVAAVALHEEVGPARTAITEVSRRAGVGRVTVYNHFPDEAALLTASVGTWLAAHPPPDPAGWAKGKDPAKRLERALTELYAYYRANEAMLAHLTRDAAVQPALAQALEAAGENDRERAMRTALLARRPERKKRRAARLEAAISLALAFGTWQRLARANGLDDAESVKLMTAAVEAV